MEHVAQTNEAHLFVVDVEIVGLSRSTDTYEEEDHLLNGQVAFSVLVMKERERELLKIHFM